MNPSPQAVNYQVPRSTSLDCNDSQRLSFENSESMSTILTNSEHFPRPQTYDLDPNRIGKSASASDILASFKPPWQEFPCLFCDSVFTKQQTLLSHQSVHTG